MAPLDPPVSRSLAESRCSFPVFLKYGFTNFDKFDNQQTCDSNDLLCTASSLTDCTKFTKTKQMMAQAAGA